MRKRPFFRVHDYIEFESNKRLDGPRWNCNVDGGGSGRYVKGIITDVELNYIQLDAIYPDGEVRTTRFPNYGSTDYDKEQWFWNGYLQHADKKKPTCECGMGDDSATHYMFCPMHDWLREQDRNANEERRKKEREAKKRSSLFRP
jgi:hypothetical protein